MTFNHREFLASKNWGFNPRPGPIEPDFDAPSVSPEPHTAPLAALDADTTQRIKAHLAGLRSAAHEPVVQPIPDAIPDSPRAPDMTFAQCCDRLLAFIDADPMLADAFLARAGNRLNAAATPTVSLQPFPSDPGTVQLAIWDNQPNGKLAKVEGDNSRDRPARYALTIKACAKGHRTPLTTKVPDFEANIGDLFNESQLRHRMKRIWKGMDADEIDFINKSVLPYAANGYLIARLMLTKPGKHFHAYHYAMIDEQELIDRDVTEVWLWTGPGKIVKLPRCSTLDSNGDAFKLVTKNTKAGVKRSVVIGQSRATDLVSPKMKSWATGDLNGE